MPQPSAHASVKRCPDCQQERAEDQPHTCGTQTAPLDTPRQDAQTAKELVTERAPESVTQPAAMEPGAGDLVGTTLAERYQIIKKLSQGGMGIVYLARHLSLDNKVAVKVLLKPQRESDQQRFLMEARLASKISHPNTVYISDFGVLPGGRSYLAMEFLDGVTLAEVLESGRLDPLRACRIAAQIARGLQAVHDKGIVHRDMKPANVFVLKHDGREDFIKIVDFGIAKATGVEEVQQGAAPGGGDGPGNDALLTVPGAVMGTPAYLSPEQGRGAGAVDARTDQYSLGVMLFELHPTVENS